jgi:predicted O-methyltransferase YrrM
MSELFLGKHAPDDISDFARHMYLESNAVLRRMEHVAESEGFPIVGPNVGTWFRQFARLTGAKRVFEFGSGYGCSACWFGQALPEDGQMYSPT